MKRFFNKAGDIFSKALEGGKHLPGQYYNPPLKEKHQCRRFTPGLFMMRVELDGIFAAAQETVASLLKRCLLKEFPTSKKITAAKALAALTEK